MKRSNKKVTEGKTCKEEIEQIYIYLIKCKKLKNLDWHQNIQFSIKKALPKN